MAPRLLLGEQPDVTYYGVVRSTLTAVDGQRLITSIYGITIPLTIVVGAVTISHYLDKPIDFKSWLGVPVKLPIGYVFGAYLCVIAVVIAEYFIAKIDLFNHFIKTSVEIGKTIENTLKLNSDICLTVRFEEHKFARERGDKLFIYSVRIFQFTAIVGLMTELIMAIYNLMPLTEGPML